MNWTTKKPSCAGWYWYSEKLDQDIIVLEVFYGRNTKQWYAHVEIEKVWSIEDMHGEWAGPIESPKNNCAN